jgi:carbon monoxide dehydrogenase subunit G
VKVQGTYTFEAPLETVWNALFDPEVLARTLPGCEKLEREGNQFKGEINVKMGPVQGKFQGKVDILDVKERESYTMIVDGRGPAGFGKATALMRVQAEGTGTRLDYDSDVQVGGKIASVGQRLIDASSRAIVKQSLEGLNQQIRALAEPVAAEGGSGPGLAPAPVQPVAAPVVPAAAAPSAPSASPGPVSPLDVPASVAPGIATAPHAPTASSSEAAWFGAGSAKPAGAAPAARPAVPVAAPARPAGPSQAGFVLGVAKEVAKDVLPLKTLLIIVAVLVLGWIIYRSVSGG